MHQLRESAVNDRGPEWATASDAEIIYFYAKEKGYTPEYVARVVGIPLPDAAHSGMTPSGGETTFLDRAGEKAVGGFVLGASLVILLAFFALARYLLPRLGAAAKKTVFAGVGAASNVVTEASMASVHAGSAMHDAYYAKAMHELSTGDVEKAMWGRSLALADGANDKAKAHYIKLRVAQLMASK